MKLRQFLFFGSLALNIVAAVFLLSMFMERIGGKRYDPSKAQDLGELRRIIYSVKPLQVAVEKYRQQHRAYPDELDVLTKEPDEKHYLEAMQSTVPRVSSVRPEGNGYQIYIKLGWDPGLFYYSAENEWIYDPGDGSDTTVIEP
ncbi:MAG: hypothetical protein V4662_13900 [Verrucomicrobiota bacterium]